MTDIDVKTYSDEAFLGKDAPSVDSLVFVRGAKEAFAAKGKVTVAFFFNTYYKGGFIVNEELTALFDKLKAAGTDVQFVAISNDPDQEKVEKLLGKIDAGTCCDPITKQVFRLNVPFVAFDDKKTVTKLYQDVCDVTVLHTPQAFIINAEGKLVWRQSFSQMFKISDSNFEAQLAAVVEGKPLDMSNGAKPKVEVEGEAAECDDMSLF
jgi:cytochrome oxidase Cu insertion factor (SCO1/SenC/PrrC family)